VIQSAGTGLAEGGFFSFAFGDAADVDAAGLGNEGSSLLYIGNEYREI